MPLSLAEILGGVAGYRSGGNLVVLRAFGLIISPAFLICRLPYKELRFIIKAIRFRRLLLLAKKHAKFPLFDSLAFILQQISQHIPIILLTAFFDPSTAGLYVKALYLCFLPSIIIGESVGQVFLQESSQAKDEGRNLATLLEVVFNRMITVAILPFSILLLIGPELFGVTLGHRWTEAGVYAQMMAPWIFTAFLFGSIRALFSTLSKQEQNLLGSGLLLITRLGALLLGGFLLQNARATILFITVSSLVIFLWLIMLLVRATILSPLVPLTQFVKCIIYVTPCAVPLAVMKWLFCLEPVYLVLSSPFLCIPYILLVLRQDFELRQLFIRTLRRVQSFI
jgi:O-antigen/teichoic acid export membrane protein